MFTSNVAALTPLLSPVTYPLLRFTWHRLQEHAVYILWFSWRYESFHFCVGGHSFFPRVDVTMNLKRFDVLFDNKLSIIRLYLFLFFDLFFFLLKSKGDVLLDPSILLGNKSRESRNKHLWDKVLWRTKALFNTNNEK